MHLITDTESLSVSSVPDLEREKATPPQDRLVPITSVKSCWAKGETLHFKWRRSGSAIFEVESYTCDSVRVRSELAK